MVKKGCWPPHQEDDLLTVRKGQNQANESIFLQVLFQRTTNFLGREGMLIGLYFY
jgi:hypothetical protein